MSKNDRLAPRTRVVQALHRIEETTGAVIPTIDMASTYAHDSNYEKRRNFHYGRDGNANSELAEELIAVIEGAARTLLFNSGMAAFTALCETLQTGDHVIAPRVMYHGGRTWLGRIAKRRGIGLSLVDMGKLDEVSAALIPGKTRLVWAETPSNPDWTIVDIGELAERIRASGALLGIDATAAPPCTTQALELGADIAFHSATKYLNGHSDLTGGVLSLKNLSLAEEIEPIRKLTGGAMPGFQAWLLIRGMRTLYLRYAQSSANAMRIATHFNSHPLVSSVLYPGLPEHPGHAVAKRQMKDGFGGMLSILAAGGFDAAAKAVRSVQVFHPATSLGGVESLIEHRKVIEGPDSPVPDNLLRLSIGIEDADDLIADIEQALQP